MTERIFNHAALSSLLQANGATPETLAQFTAAPVETTAKWFAHVETPSLENAKKIARAYSVPLSFFYTTPRTNDPVNNPSHYTTGEIECIDFIEDQGFGVEFCYGNAIKYLVRARHKQSEVNDLCKAIWYIERRLQQISGPAR